MSDTLLQGLRDIVGERGYIAATEARQRSCYVGRHIPLQCKALLRPASTDEVAAILALCYEHGQSVVTQGGNSGLVGGQYSRPGDIALSLERMHTIEHVDTADRTAIVQAGTVLQTLQEAAQDLGMEFQLDLGARGSSTIGGNIATNAGGNRVIRYGMMREQVLGLEVVLADGTIIDSMHGHIKDNTGYDLKQLFIGSEGTLGIVTRAIIKLHSLHKSDCTALLGVEAFEKLPPILNRLQAALGGTLSAFEVMWHSFYQTVIEGNPTHKEPMGTNHPYYVLIEHQGGTPEADQERFEGILAELMMEGLIIDACLATNQQQREALWAIRDDIETLVASMPVNCTFDVSLSLSNMTQYIQALERALPQRKIIFGHLGDGNIHIMVEAADESAMEAINEQVYALLGDYGGSISAEHGIGLLKRDYLHHSRNAAEIALMGTLKRALDPKNLLNPGKVLG